MIEILHKIRRLSVTEWWLLWQSFVLLPLNAVSLNLLGLNRWQRLLLLLTTEKKVKTNPIGEDLLKARQTARIVDAAARRGIFKANCLQRSMTLWLLLKRRGIDSQLKIGVRLTENQLQAHAWIEYLNLVLNDGSQVSEVYSPFMTSFNLIERGNTDRKRQYRMNGRPHQ